MGIVPDHKGAQCQVIVVLDQGLLGIHKLCVLITQGLNRCDPCYIRKQPCYNQNVEFLKIARFCHSVAKSQLVSHVQKMKRLEASGWDFGTIILFYGWSDSKISNAELKSLTFPTVWVGSELFCISLHPCLFGSDAFVTKSFFLYFRLRRRADCSTLTSQLRHTTFMEELVFWTVKYEFPEKLVCLLLKMLPDAEYKEAFTRAFVTHYSR